MDRKTTLSLQEAGVDIESALRRFSGNAALYERFLLKFPQDDNFEKMGPAFARGELDTVLMAAHTLKGVSGNLGMGRLYQACSDTVALLRGGESEQAYASYQELESAYSEVCKALVTGEA